MRLSIPRTSPAANRSRSGYTLVELMLSLALVVVAAALIGSVMQLYARNFMTRSDDVRRMQLAQAILHMIADDIRAVVTEQAYDGSVLEQQLGASGGGSAPPDASTEALASATVPPDSGSSDDPSTESTSGVAMDVETIASLPPGLYGDQYSLTLTVSRVPRPDEYLVTPPSLLEGTLVDVPGDIKTVSYYVQAPTTQGVADVLESLGGTADDGISAGLVRRALDRAVIAYAQDVGNVQAMERSGDLIAPEVVSIEFAYYDGTQGQWVYQWDSSQQALPWLVQIAVAMQSASGEEAGKFQPGTPISSLTLEDRQTFGIEVYELVVAIPGANLKAADAAEAEAAGGLDSVGL